MQNQKPRLRPAALLLFLALAPAGCINVEGLSRREISTVTLEPSPYWLDVNRVAVIDIAGFMTSSNDGGLGLLGETSVADVKERLDRAASDWRVKAVVLRIDTPGGEVTAADVMYRQVVRFREETGLPVVACLMNLATSGGYYVACACDRVVALPTSLTGSVGVIMRYYNIEGLLGKVGLQRVVIKSGEKKDIASATRPMTPEEERILQGINGDLFARFVAVVRKGRPRITEENMRLIEDGRVLTAVAALQMGMVDRLGYLEDAVAEAKTLAGIKTAHVIGYRTGSQPNTNLYAGTRIDPRTPDVAAALAEALQALALRRGPGFLYLWAPGL